MNFIEAIEQANSKIVRRKAWGSRLGGLKIIPKLGIPKLFWVGPNVASGTECKILGLDTTIDLQEDDLVAEDWEICSSDSP